MNIRIGTRGSTLALWQSEYVMHEMQKRYPEHTYETVIIKTKGDRIQTVALDKIGDKGLFVKEIEEQLLTGSIDIAVHSMKDMPSNLPQGLVFSKSLKREDARDVLILKEDSDLQTLKKGARIGTGSKRRAIQLKALRPDLTIVDIRGNLDTRLQKLQTEAYDGIVVAAAGVKRLGMESMINYYFKVEEMIPASAQGTLAIEVREDRQDLLALLDPMGDEDTEQCILAERNFLQAIGGSCHIPVGAHCIKQDAYYTLYAIYGEGDRSQSCIITGTHPRDMGILAAEKLKRAMEITG
ncbi:MAG: hydroxymethylbilane synthase [Lachnospiraceae bacterium]